MVAKFTFLYELELQIELIELDFLWCAIPGGVDEIVLEVFVLDIGSTESLVEFLLLCNGVWFLLYSNDDCLKNGPLLIVWFSGIMIDRVCVDLRVGVREPNVSELLRELFILFISVVDEDSLSGAPDSLGAVEKSLE